MVKLSQHLPLGVPACPQSLPASDSSLTLQVNDKPAVHLILLRDEGAGTLGVFGDRGSAKEEAGEALEHGGVPERPHGGTLGQGKNLGKREESGLAARSSPPLLAWYRERRGHPW